MSRFTVARDCRSVNYSRGHKEITRTANNDIFVVGDYCYIAHYNGKDFHLFPEITTSISLYELRSCDFKNNMMIAVGGPGKAVIVRMWR